MSINKLERIEWLVKFAQTDIDAMKFSDRVKLVIDVTEYLFPEREINKIKENLEIILLWEKILTKARNGKTGVLLKGKVEHEDQYSRYPVSRIESTIDAYDDDPETYWNMIRAIQQLLYNTLNEVVLLGSDSTNNKNQILPKEAYGVINISIIVDDQFHDCSIPATNNLHHYIQVKVYTLLNGFQATAIKRCLGCGRIFFNPSLREKKFCLARCQSRFHAAKRRRESKQEPNVN